MAEQGEEKGADAGKQRNQLHAYARVFVGFGIGENFEGQRQKRVTGQNGGGFVKGAVQRGFAAAGIRIVHRRKVVVDQRIAMHEFGGSGDAARAATGGTTWRQWRSCETGA